MDAYQTGNPPLHWFLLSGAVGRQQYVKVGIGLAIMKYAIEALAIYLLLGQFFSPVDFVNPWLSSKAPFLVDAPYAGIIWLMFTIPFVWIAIAMSTRRAADIGFSPWWGMSMLIPLVNLVSMGVLALLPSGLTRLSPQKLARAREQKIVDEAFQPPEETDMTVSSESKPGEWAAAISAGACVQLGIGIVTVWLLHTYGFILFFSAPVVAGAVAGFVFRRYRHRSVGKIILLILVMNVVGFTGMLCCGLDGAVCLIMAFPLLGPLSLLGAFVGAAIAKSQLRPGVDERPGAAGLLVLLPFCLMLESLDTIPPTHRVSTYVDIDAPREAVWEHVLAFPDIEEELAWYFKAGIAAPLRARIDGHGVGAVRHCEFTTGEFIEPITVWDQPSRLAFDVISQPMPMQEWTPIPHLHPPHLDNGLVSKRGEFRLQSRPNGQTRLWGTTWYEIDVRPRLYWKAFADPMLHTIHRRVLNHIGHEVAKSQQSARHKVLTQSLRHGAAPLTITGSHDGR